MTIGPRSTAALEKTQFDLAENKARRFWVSVVVGFLGLQIAIGIVAVYLATSDPTVAVIPNYYQSAVNWDTTRRARELTQDLGWKIDATVGPVANEQRQIQVRLLTRSGKTIDDVRMTGEFFHHANGTEIHRVKFQALESGVYVADCGLTQAGVWQMNVRIEGDHGIAATNREIRVQ